jgi:pimeloyl-ACP methyl ester carboxylesterase
VASLVLIAPFCYPVDPLSLVPRPLPGLRKAWGMTGMGAAVFRRLFRRADLRDFLERSLARPDELDLSTLDVYWDRLTRDGGMEAAEAMVEHIEGIRALADAFRRIETRCTVVWGETDRIVPIEHGRRLVDAMHRATLVELAHCGHAPHRERPNALLELF